MSEENKVHYFKVAKKHSDYLGVRFFKVNYNSDTVVQVCINNGEPKKGKGNHIGVYLISRESLFANYVAYARVVSCERDEYVSAFKTVIKFMKP